MIDDRCQHYLEDPEANASHIEECAECRALQSGLAVSGDLPASTINVNNLPLAPWEGASHRPWPLIIGGVLGVAAVALALCSVAGISPVTVAQDSIASMSSRRAMIDSMADSLRNASLGGRIAFGVFFITVNALLIVLLRKAPRGVDA